MRVDNEKEDIMQQVTKNAGHIEIVYHCLSWWSKRPSYTIYMIMVLIIWMVWFNHRNMRRGIPNLFKVTNTIIPSFNLSRHWTLYHTLHHPSVIHQSPAVIESRIWMLAHMTALKCQRNASTIIIVFADCFIILIIICYRMVLST